jgi:hypothetical protein
MAPAITAVSYPKRNPPRAATPVTKPSQRIGVLAAGPTQADAGQTLPDAEVRERMAKWLR